MTKPMRRDGVRNRERLLTEAADVLATRGLNGSLEEIARRAGVSIGTLYKHFPTRADLVEALLTPHVTALDEVAAKALADPDPWSGLTGFLADMVTRFTADRALLEAFTGDHAAAAQLEKTCARGISHIAAITERARDSGQLRADATDSDIANLMWALALLGENAGSEAWQRAMALVLDGLQARPAD
ncbi:TetR/AcrR family transcriptional regulator [Nocardia sp. NPDC004722]